MTNELEIYATIGQLESLIKTLPEEERQGVEINSQRLVDTFMTLAKSSEAMHVAATLALLHITMQMHRLQQEQG